VESCRTLLPWICSSHLKDGALCFDRDGGARWYGVLLGDGSCRVRETVAMLRGHHPGIQLNVEDLWDTFSVPLGRPDFLPGRYRASRNGLAEVVRWLHHGEGLRAEGRIPGREDLESDRRWEIVRERFPKNLERAKEIVNDMARAAPEAGA